MARLRARAPYAVLHPETGVHVVPPLTEYYDEKDPLVKAHRWLFATDDELDAAQTGEIVESVAVEQATAAPGERRNVRRR